MDWVDRTKKNKRIREWVTLNSLEIPNISERTLKRIAEIDTIWFDDDNLDKFIEIFIKFSSPFRKENLKKGWLTYIFIIIHIGSFILLNLRIEFTKYNYYKDYLL